MCHTSPCGTVDVGNIRGYGWKNQRKLSTVTTDLDTGVQGPEQNAGEAGIHLD